MLVIPAIDLRRGRCVRLTQGIRDSVKVYDGDPVAIAIGHEAQGARLLHVVDLDGAFSEPNSANRETLKNILRAIKIPIQFGGGLRNLDQVKQAIDLGLARVVLGTLAIESPETVFELLGLCGSERIAVGIDAKDGQVVTRGWEKESAVPAIEFARRLAAAGVRRIVYTDVARDGMLSGVNVEATCAIARASGLKVTASGGVSSLADISNVSTAGCGIDSLIVGKALYEGRFTLPDALLAGNQSELE